MHWHTFLTPHFRINDPGLKAKVSAVQNFYESTPPNRQTLPPRNRKKGGLRVPKEINLLARFTMLERAQACRDALRHQGFDVVQIDNIPSMESSQLLNHAPMVEWGRYGYEFDRLDDKWTVPAPWDHHGLGYSEDWLLTAVVPHDEVDKASAIITDFGGKL